MPRSKEEAIAAGVKTAETQHRMKPPGRVYCHLITNEDVSEQAHPRFAYSFGACYSSKS